MGRDAGSFVYFPAFLITWNEKDGWNFNHEIDSNYTEIFCKIVNKIEDDPKKYWLKK